MPVDVSEERFDELVDRALDQIPDALARHVHNVVVLVEQEPPADQPPDLLGLYVGIAMTERDSQFLGNLPDQIFIYRGPLQRMCHDEEELVREVTITVVHEVAHHFGIDDDRLHELGYG